MINTTEMIARVDAIRQELSRRGLSGLMIPHADEYQNEYTPACAERLAWATGFTGSAGMAVILQDAAAIFVDGRYVLQVEHEVISARIKAYHSAQTSWAAWLREQLQPGCRLGYDPWLHSLREVEQLAHVCEHTQAALVPCDDNPIDAVWTSRPATPRSVVRSHELTYAGASSTEKRASIARTLRADVIDAAVLTAPDSVAWLLNIRGNDVAYTPLPLCRAILFNDGRVTLFLRQDTVSVELREHMGPDVSVCEPDAFGQELDKLGQRRLRVLYDVARSPAWGMDRLSRAGAHVIQQDDPCVLPKACKNSVEVDGARACHARDGVALCRFFAWLARHGLGGEISEMEASSVLDALRRESEHWKDLSFPTISAAGAHGAIVHYRSSSDTNGRLQPGSLFLVDSGAQYRDGTTDVTRTVAIGTPTDEQRDRYTRVLKGHIALAMARFPEGTTGSQLDALARRFLWEAGLDYDHGTGHGVGSYLGVHEGPQRISKTGGGAALRPGMILSNEPGYYKAGAYGIRIENLMVVVPCGEMRSTDRTFLAFETLTMAPFDRELIHVGGLSEAERAWIDAYHARVYDCVASRLDDDAAAWLSLATAPLDG